MWVILAFGSALFAGITSIFAKIGIKNVNSNLATAIRTSIVLIFSWVMVFITNSFKEISQISPKTLIFLILSGLATGGSWLCYFKALQLGDINKVIPIDKSSTVLTMILAYIVLGEKFNFIRIFGMISISLGTYMMITKKQTDKKADSDLWIIYAVFSAVFASLTSILGKIGISNINSNLGTAIRTVVVLIMAWIVVFISKSQKKIKTINKKSWIFIFLSGLTTGLSWLCYYKSLQDGQASIVVPIDKLSIVVTIIFSYIVLKEKLSKNSIIGTLVLLF